MVQQGRNDSVVDAGRKDLRRMLTRKCCGVRPVEVGMICEKVGESEWESCQMPCEGSEQGGLSEQVGR